MGWRRQRKPPAPLAGFACKAAGDARGTGDGTSCPPMGPVSPATFHRTIPSRPSSPTVQAITSIPQPLSIPTAAITAPQTRGKARRTTAVSAVAATGITMERDAPMKPRTRRWTRARRRAGSGSEVDSGRRRAGGGRERPAEGLPGLLPKRDHRGRRRQRRPRRQRRQQQRASGFQASSLSIMPDPLPL